MPFRPASSAVARQIIESAHDELERTILPEESHNFSVTTLEHVRSAAMLIETQLAARRSLRNMQRLDPLFSGLEHYGQVMGVLCNGTPFLPWIWAPIALILRISAEYIEAFEKIIKGYSKISESLKRFRTLDKVCAASPDLQQTLAVYYADILQFHTHAYKFVRRKGWKLMFLTSWGRFERRFEHIIEDMKQHEKLVDKQAAAEGVASTREIREEIKSWREESLAAVQKSDEKQAGKHFESILAWLKAEESDQNTILDTIQNEGAKFAGTCDWALKNGRVKAWLQKTPEPSILRLHGSPGSGKSVLAGQIVRFMRSAKSFLIHHFCTHRYASSTTYEQLLRSILLQLLRKDDDLIAHVYDSCVTGKSSPTIQALEKLICNLFNMATSQTRETDYIWIIIDGLNECESRVQASILNLIKQITAKKTSAGETICKVLISSRMSPHIANRMGKTHMVSLSEEKSSLKLAIRNYVSQRLVSMHQKLQELELTQKDIDNIINVIANKADGMFLYARLVLDYLGKNIFYSGKEMKESIDALPKELSEFYKQILLQITVQLNPRSVERVKSVFGWISFAKRPLKRIEFLSALTFSSGEWDKSSLVPKHVLDYCGALVEEKADTTLTFIHISVKEFLQSSSSNVRISIDETLKEHCTAALTCLVSGADTFLGDLAQHSQAQRIAKGLHGFHVYATEFWTEYLLEYTTHERPEDKKPVLMLASQLAEKLAQSKLDDVAADAPSVDTMDPRVNDLADYPSLKRLLEFSLESRSVKVLQSNLLHEMQQDWAAISRPNIVQPSMSAPPPEPRRDKVSLMLSSYQDLVKMLLAQEKYPGISDEELETFKSQFRGAAFTCRLRFCPRATTGFDSEELRRQHEIAHTQVSQCSVPDCEYPPFATRRALRNHINKYHSSKPARRPIRSSGDGIPRLRRVSSNVRMLESENEGAKSEGESDEQLSRPTAHAPDIPERPGDESHPQRTRPSRRDSVISDSGKSDALEHVRLDSIGFHMCSIQDCGARVTLRSAVAKRGGKGGLIEVLEDHYWNAHHADTMLRCGVNLCDMIFASRAALQAHYQQRHTVLLCNHCEEFPDGFTLESELRHHWRYYHHLKLVRRWICDDSNHFEVVAPIMLGVPSTECNSCLTKHKFESKEEAMSHWVSVHFVESDDVDVVTQRLAAAERVVRQVWVYEGDEEYEDGDKRGAWQADFDDSDDDEIAVLDDIFYVEELA